MSDATNRVEQIGSHNGKPIQTLGAIHGCTFIEWESVDVNSKPTLSLLNWWNKTLKSEAFSCAQIETDIPTKWKQFKFIYTLSKQ